MALLDYPQESHKQHFLRWEGDIAKTLLLVSLDGREELSAPFQYQIRSLTRQSESEVAGLHGTSVVCRIGDGGFNMPQRYLHGVVTRIHYVSRSPEEAECILTVEPSLALLRLGRMMRIWQNVSVPTLVQTLLREYGIRSLDVELHRNYSEREYCVQYRESASDFIQRLLEEEGIYYYFRHSASAHTLVLADHPASHPKIQGGSLLWHTAGSVLTETTTIDSWSATSSLLPEKVVIQGVNMPQATTIEEKQNASGTGTHIEGISFTDITPQGERQQVSRTAQAMIAARETNACLFTATVNAHWLCSGETFTLKGHPSGKKSYRIHTQHFSAANNFDDNSSNYHCELQAMSNDQAWHPPVRLRAPEIAGILTATVVGPSSEEVHTDEYGRIKIQFPWDKENPHDDTSSCWVRVAQPWTGGKFGAQFIPRVGCEVLVSFVQGHPDYPLVTGTVYNGQNKPPFALPGEKTESGFVTRSSTKGSVDDGHRLSFNDKKGEERLTIIAQKDLSLTVKNDSKTTIAANRSTELTKGNDRLLLKEGDLNVTLEKGNWQQEITGNATTKLSNGDYVLQVTSGDGRIKTDKTLTLESDQSIELKVGSNIIKLSSSGISINGTTIKIKGTSSAEMKAATVKVEGSANAELKGMATTVSGTTITTIDGQLIKIG